MKVSFKDLLDSLGVDKTLEGYQTQPWQVEDASTGIVCSAELSVLDGDCEELEAEIIIENKKASIDDPRLYVVMWMSFEKVSGGKYTLKKCRFKGDDFTDTVSAWDSKACSYFKSTVKALKNNEMPDFEKIEASIMSEDGSYAGGGQGGGRQPKINTNKLLYDMKRGGMGR